MAFRLSAFKDSKIQRFKNSMIQGQSPPFPKSPHGGFRGLSCAVAQRLSALK
jgi:hypothetical protein